MPYLNAGWPLAANIRAFTTLRPGGYSQGVFEGLNLGYRVGDDPSCVTKNIAQLVSETHLPYTPQWMEQVHGAEVVSSENMQTPTKADGVYSHRKGQICGILTADCLPILIAHPEAKGIAALHGGWRSLHQGIIETGLQRLALPCHELYVWLGPAISKKAYVVGSEFRETFLDKDPNLAHAFYQDEQEQWHGDLYAIARMQLQRLGVQHIYGGQYCTYSDPLRFYSARHSIHHTKQTGGRMASLIWIAEDPT